MTRSATVATTSASLAAFLSGTAALWMATDGFAAFTAEAARRLRIEAAPQPVPAVDILLSDGRLANLRAFGRPLLVDFVYASCPTICTTLGQEFLQIQQEVTRLGLTDRIHLVSLSFDIERDSPAMLAAYAKHHGADAAVWSVGRPRDARDLARLLGTFGVTVIPDGEGGFVHNAALHYVDADGRLARIFDLGDVGPIVAILSQGKPDGHP